LVITNGDIELMEDNKKYIAHKGFSIAATAELPVGTTSIETRHEVAPGWNADNTMFEPCVCFWDTGATYCGVSDALADKWGLENLGDVKTFYANDDYEVTPSYAITLRFADGSKHMITASRQHMSGVDITIGLSLISDGIFTLMPTANHGSIFTFEIPQNHNDIYEFLR